MFDAVQSAIDTFEAAVNAKALDTSNLDGLTAADTAAQAKLDAATAAKTATQAAIDTQAATIAADNAAIKAGLLAIATAATDAAASL